MRSLHSSCFWVQVTCKTLFDLLFAVTLNIHFVTNHLRHQPKLQNFGLRFSNLRILATLT